MEKTKIVKPRVKKLITKLILSQDTITPEVEPETKPIVEPETKPIVEPEIEPTIEPEIEPIIKPVKKIKKIKIIEE